jgi:DNA-binding HxlR family transcriptional regulator
MIERRVIPETPVRVEYLLTEKGHALSGVMDAISAWATEWHDDAAPDAHTCADEHRAQPAGDRRRP